MEGPMGLKMGEEEINEYVNGLLTGKLPTPEGLEGMCISKFKALSGEIAILQQRIQQHKAAFEAGLKDVDRLNGSREAYVNLLILAEEGRRNLQAVKEGKLKLVPKEGEKADDEGKQKREGDTAAVQHSECGDELPFPENAETEKGEPNA